MAPGPVIVEAVQPRIAPDVFEECFDGGEALSSRVLPIARVPPLQTVIDTGSGGGSAALAVQMLPDSRGERLGHRRQPLGIVRPERIEPAMEELEQILDDLDVAQPQLVQ